MKTIYFFKIAIVVLTILVGFIIKFPIVFITDQFLSFLILMLIAWLVQQVFIKEAEYLKQQLDRDNIKKINKKMKNSKIIPILIRVYAFFLLLVSVFKEISG